MNEDPVHVSHRGTDTLTLLAMFQLADSIFPTGGFTLSHGLEAAVDAGLVSGPDELEAFLRVLLAHSVGPLDAVALAGAWRAAKVDDLETVKMIDEQLFTRKLAREGREAAVRMGRSLLAVAGILTDEPLLSNYRDMVNGRLTPGTHAVALGVLTSVLGIGEREAIIVDLYTFSVAYLGAAQRLLPLDHLAVQAMLYRLRPTLADLAKDAMSRPWQEMASFAPEAEILAMRHERTLVRMFAS